MSKRGWIERLLSPEAETARGLAVLALIVAGTAAVIYYCDHLNARDTARIESVWRAAVRAYKPERAGPPFRPPGNILVVADGSVDPMISHFGLPESLYAPDLEHASVLLWVESDRTKVGAYHRKYGKLVSPLPELPAEIVDKEVWIVSVPSGQVTAHSCFSGEMPPREVTIGASEHSPDKADDQLTHWLQSLPVEEVHLHQSR